MDFKFCQPISTTFYKSTEPSKCTRCGSPMLSNQMSILCISCKRSARQKEKEAWLALPDSSNPIKPSTETNENILSIANNSLISRLECPVCYQLMLPPLRQCQNGHSICSRCNIRLSRCPTCRRSFIDTPNVLLNEICLSVAIPCQYYPDGCRQLVRLVDKIDHEKHCPWKKYSCPEESKCGWKGFQVDVVNHVMQQHSGGISRIGLNCHASLRYTYGPIHPIEESNTENEYVNVASRTLLLVDDNGDGLQVFVFSLKYDSASGSLCGVLRLIGAKEDASNYNYKLKLASPDRTFRMSITTLCVAFDENIDDVITKGAVMKIDGQMFKKFVNDEGKFFVWIKIDVVCDENDDLI